MPAPQITATRAPGTFVVRAAGAVIGESSNAIVLTEGSQPPVIYFPREDIEMAFLERSDHQSVCPHKGTATYFDIVAKSGVIKNAAWSYESPLEGVARIAGHLAFYPDKATVEEV